MHVQYVLNTLTPLSTLGPYLWLAELHQLQNVSLQAVVFGSGVSEHVDEGSRQRNLQGFLYGSYAHLRTVAPALSDIITNQILPEEIKAKYHILNCIHTDFTVNNSGIAQLSESCPF